MSNEAMIDGKSGACLPVEDRGLAYGDGLFETVRFVDGVAPLWRGHMARLARGCRRLRLAAPSRDALLDDARRLAADGNCIVKLIVTRIGGRGYAPDVAMSSRRIAVKYAAPTLDPAAHVDGVRLRWCRLTLAEQPALAGLKHLNRLEQVIARAEWRDPRIHDALICAGDGRVVCATSANIFVVRQGRLLTPRVDRCGVAGVARAWILARARRWLPVEEIDLQRRDIESGDEVFLSNAVHGVVPVRALAATRFMPGPVTRRLGYTLARLGIGRSPDAFCP